MKSALLIAAPSTFHEIRKNNHQIPEKKSFYAECANSTTLTYLNDVDGARITYLYKKPPLRTTMTQALTQDPTQALTQAPTQAPTQVIKSSFL
jgi:hypothetical protein